jgi:SET domain-containing protein
LSSAHPCPRSGCCPRRIDATHWGNVARLMNHSCEPNLIVVSVCQPHEADATTRLLILQAARDIVAGEELTFSYTFL